MNILLADPLLVIGDTVLPMGDESVPMWDIVYAHQIGIAPATYLLDAENEEEAENAAIAD